MLIVSQVTFANAAAAKKATTQELVKARMEDEEATIVEESGAGDRAFWATTKRGAQYMVLKNATVIAVAFGGGLPKPPATYHDALRSAATAAVTR